MPLTKKQLQTLLCLVATVETDESDCDACFEHLSEFAEAELAGIEIPDALEAVRNHLRQCACCRKEYEALMQGLRGLDE